MNCDFCGKPGHADDPCPVRRESAVRHAEEGAKAYPQATGVEAMVCDVVVAAVAAGWMTGEHGGVICREIAARQRLGAAKYGRMLANNPATLRERLRHALEESLDLAVYVQWAMASDKAQGILHAMSSIRSDAIESAKVLLDAM
jgi:hypothetical protein